MGRIVAFVVAFVVAACEQTNGEPTGPTVVTATATSSAPPPPPADAGNDAEAGACAGYASPSTTATCHACGANPCNANGCFGAYWCDLGALKCVPKPASCP